MNGNLHYTYVLVDPRTSEVFYAGKGVDRRMRNHTTYAKRENHCNPKLKNKILRILGLGLNVVGEKIFEHEDEWPCHWVEVQAIAFYGRGHLCNLTDGGEGMTGYVVSEETRAKLASITGEKHHHFGKKLSEEHRSKMSKALIGRLVSEETRSKISERNKSEKIRASISAKLTGRTISQETRDKMSKSRLGIVLPEATKAKIAESLMGANNANFGKPKSEETKAKMRAAALALGRSGKNSPLFGRPKSEETRAKLSAANSGKGNHMLGKTGEKHHFFGKKHSQETKDKISDSKRAAALV